MTTPKNVPADHVRLGAIQAAIWANETENGLRYSVTFERRYFDAKANDWKSSGSYNRDDLLVLAKAADLAHSRIHELQSLSRAKQPEAADEADASETRPRPRPTRPGALRRPLPPQHEPHGPNPARAPVDENGGRLRSDTGADLEGRTGPADHRTLP